MNTACICSGKVVNGDCFILREGPNGKIDWLINNHLFLLLVGGYNSLSVATWSVLLV